MSGERAKLALRALVVAALGGAAWILAVPGREPTIVVASTRQVFWTSEKLEPDTIACAWLLTRFVASGCEIRLLPRGERSDVGTPFDLPLVSLSRDRTRSSYHVIRAENGLEDARLRSLGALVDEVEIGAWNALRSESAAAFEARLRACITDTTEPAAALEAGCRVLDEIYANLPAV